MPPYRAEHIGSLLRPPGLLEGRVGEDEAIEQVLRWQESLGLRVVTDGEFRRESWRLGFISRVSGFALAESVGEVDLQHDDAGNTARIGSAPLAIARVRRTGPIVADEVAFSLRRTHCTVKATLPAPSYLHYPRGARCIEPSAYASLEEFFADIVRIYREEIAALHAAGGRYLQIDEVAQPVLCDPRLREAVRARGDDPDRLVELYIDLINRVLDGRPRGMIVGVHMCRGNALGRWMASGAFDPIADRAFNGLEVDALFLEYDSERAGGFEALRFVPPGRHVVLGLVSTKTAALEDADELKRRIDAASRYVPLERLSISPQCGFASHRKGTGLSFADQEAKLRLVIEVARDVWGEG